MKAIVGSVVWTGKNYTEMFWLSLIHGLQIELKDLTNMAKQLSAPHCKISTMGKKLLFIDLQ